MISICRPSLFLRSVARFPFFAAGLLFLFAAGCGKSSTEVTDPQLKPIQEMLNSQLPTGSSEGTVQQFLSARGYPIERASQPGTLVALIRHIDTEKLQPVTARVTFYFDANGRLNTTEIERTFNRRPPMESTDSKNPPDATDPNNPPNATNSSNSTNP
jgi:hypothetical protein